MDKAVKEKWVAALRSGEYKQARYSLEDAGAMCCLGVLCYELFNDARAKQEREVGLELLDPIFLGEIEMSEREQGTLSAMNDGTGSFFQSPRSFEQIADYIEEKL